MMDQHKLKQFGWMALAACSTIGVGIGMLFDDPGTGAIIGAGAGWLIVAAIYLRNAMN